ncbi:MAG: hypothetical protein IV094_14180 [Vitreoscilla sp.]|nr:hypothetical protein [Vitreoscilla sp.]
MNNEGGVIARVFSCDNLEPDDPLRVVIKAFPHGRHLGFLVQADDGYRMVHLAWDDRLQNEPFSEPSYCWVDLAGVHPVNRESFADWLLTTWPLNVNPGIPYSFAAFTGEDIDDQGRHVRVDEGAGLTCATFVLSTLAKFGVDIVERESWPPRLEDEPDILRAIDYLKKSDDAAKLRHAAACEKLIKKVARFRPEEVAGCATTFRGKPIEFQQGEQLGKAVLDQMAALGLS